MVMVVMVIVVVMVMVMMVMPVVMVLGQLQAIDLGGSAFRLPVRVQRRQDGQGVRDGLEQVGDRSDAQRAGRTFDRTCRCLRGGERVTAPIAATNPMMVFSMFRSSSRATHGKPRLGYNSRR